MSLAKIKPIPEVRFRIKDSRETKLSIPVGVDCSKSAKGKNSLQKDFTLQKFIM